MKTAWLGLATLTFVWACGGDGGSGQPANTAGSASGGSGTAGTSTTGGGGAAGSSTAGSSAVGGSTAGAGGSGTAGTAGAGTAGTAGGGTAGSGGMGGSGTTGFKCPAGSETMAVTVPTSAGQPIANVPPAGGNPDNLEGPVWINGWLYLSEIAKRGNDNTQPQGGRIIRLQPGQAAEVFLADVGTNGLAVNAEGDLVAASQKLGAIVSFDLKATPPSPTPKKTYAGMYMNTRFSSPNDVAVRSDGTVYFTDPAYQAGSVKQSAERAYWATPAGVVSVIPDTGAPPNGIILSPDEKTLYVGGNKLSSYPVMADGSLGAGKTFPSDQNGVFGTDGLGMDCAGNIYVAMYSQGVVDVYKPAGDKIGTIQVGSGVTNVAFGGADGKTLYITRMTPPSLYSVPSTIPGLPY